MIKFDQFIDQNDQKWSFWSLTPAYGPNSDRPQIGGAQGRLVWPFLNALFKSAFVLFRCLHLAPRAQKNVTGAKNKAIPTKKAPLRRPFLAHFGGASGPWSSRAQTHRGQGAIWGAKLVGMGWHFERWKFQRLQRLREGMWPLDLVGMGTLFQLEFDLYVNSRLRPFWKVWFGGAHTGGYDLPRPTGATLEPFLKGLIGFESILPF